MRRYVLGCVVLAILSAGCHGNGGSPRSNQSGGPAGNGAVGAPGMSLPFDVRTMLDRTQGAFRQDAQGFTATRATYTVQVASGGRAALTLAAVGRGEPDGSVVAGSSGVSAPSVANQAAAQVSLETVELARGGTPVDVGSGLAALDSDGQLLVARATALEQLRSTPEGLEQSWTFAAPPAGSGDLTVRVRLAGLAAVGQTAGGLHFRDGNGSGLRYGRATWLDGTGRTTDVPVALDGDAVVITVSEALLESSAFPAVLDPLVSPEEAMDEPVSTGVGRASIAFDGATYLIAWSDATTGQIFASRLTQDGRVLDPTGIYVGAGAANASSPEVAYGAGTYLVTWSSTASGGVVQAARITPGGSVLDPSPIAIANGSSPAVAFDGANFLVTWLGPDATGYGAWGYRAVHVSPAGAMTHAPVMLSMMMGGRNSTATAACSGASCLVLWESAASYCASGTVCSSPFSVLGARVGPAGELLDPTPITVGGTTWGQASIFLPPRAAFDGANWLVVWGDDRIQSGNLDVYGARVTADGVPLDGSGFLVVGGPGDQRNPRPAFDGTNYVVSWGDLRSGIAIEAYAGRVTRDGAALDGGGVPVALGIAQRPVLALGNGTSGVIGWTANGTLYATRIAETATAGGTQLSIIDASGIPVTAGSRSNTEQAAAVASDGTNYLVVWRDDRMGPQGVYAVRVSAYGAVLDARVLTLPVSATSLIGPVVDFDGTDYLVAWWDLSMRQVSAARVHPDGTVLDPLVAIPIAAAAPAVAAPLAISVAGYDAGWLVHWTEAPTGTNRIVGARVDAQGNVLDPAPLVLADNASGPAQIGNAAFDGQRFLLVYERGDRLSTAGLLDVYGAFFDPHAAALGAEFPIAVGPAFQFFPAVQFDGTNYLVVWRDTRNTAATGYWSTVPAEIWAARINPAGTILGPPVVLASGSAWRRYNGISFDGKYLLTSWEEVVGGSTATSNILGARMRADGTVVDSTPLLLVPEQMATGFKGMASNHAGTILLAYGSPDPATGRARVKARTITSWAPIRVQNVGLGTGHVRSVPAGVDCPGTCSAPFDAPTTVTLTATPDAGQTFVTWKGACTGNAPTCTVTADVARDVLAVFGGASLPFYQVSVATIGTGTGTVQSAPVNVTCAGGTCSGRFISGAVVTLTPAPDAGSHFTGWTGACQGAGTCVVAMNGDKAVGAIFDAGVTVPTAPAPSLSPASADSAASTTVTVTGSRFAAGTTVSFGGVPGNVVAVLSDTRLQVTTPTGLAAGPVDVAIVNPDGSTFTLPGAFTFHTAAANTPTGAGVSVTATQASSSVPVTDLRFENVQGGGTTTVQALFVPPAPVPSTFAVVGDPAKPAFFDIQTTAQFVPGSKIEIAIHYDPRVLGLTPAQEAALRLIHYACPTPTTCAWEDATEVANPHVPAYTDEDPHYYGRSAPAFQNPDTRNKILYGVTTSLSPFAPALGGSLVPLQVMVFGGGTIQGDGIACSAAGGVGCVTSIALTSPPQLVTLTAVPDASSMFWGWGGACAGQSAVCTIPVTFAWGAVANFVPASFQLTVNMGGAGSGSVTGGTIACMTGSASGCSMGVANTTPRTKVVLTATASPGSVFKGWSQPCVSSGAGGETCTVEVGQDTMVIPTFERDTRRVTMQTYGDGSGAISAAGHTCSTASAADCVFTVPNAAVPQAITFTAAATAGSHFVGWGGSCAGQTGSICTVPATGDFIVGAAFAPDTYTLTVTAQGGGGGSVTGGPAGCIFTSAGGSCSGSVANTTPAQQVTLSAAADGGSIFVGWAGLCSGTGTCNVSMSSAQTVVALFQPSTYPLTVQTWGAGRGTVTGPGISCSTGSAVGCAAPVNNTAPSAPAQVVLTAAPDASSVFTGWTQPCVTNPDGSCTVTVGQATLVAATFAPKVP
jgi:hypothetical protein